uniref:Uncharacterized protein n=1 Tax=Sphaerodactylus townsendi TaxID=933632 RepID=A0ACB8EMR8_9SAUR
MSHRSGLDGPVESWAGFLKSCHHQVIVMSGHETIRVLEVGVDAPLPVDNTGKTVETATPSAGGEAPMSCPPEPSETGKEGGEQNVEKAHGNSGGEVKMIPEVIPAPVPGVIPFSQMTSQQTQTLTPVTVQAAPQNAAAFE